MGFMKKISFFLSISLLVILLLPGMAFAAESTGGTCGDHLVWILDGDGKYRTRQLERRSRLPVLAN